MTDEEEALIRCDDHAAQVEQIVAACCPLLHGQDPGVVGAVLADLTAMWVAGHRPDMRDEVFAMHNEHVRMFIPLNDRWPKQ